MLSNLSLDKPCKPMKKIDYQGVRDEHHHNRFFTIPSNGVISIVDYHGSRLCSSHRFVTHNTTVSDEWQAAHFHREVHVILPARTDRQTRLFKGVVRQTWVRRKHARTHVRGPLNEENSSAAVKKATIRFRSALRIVEATQLQLRGAADATSAGKEERKAE